MAEHRPLLIFPKPKAIRPEPKKGRFGTVHHPTVQQQVERFGERFRNLVTAFDRETTRLSLNSLNIDPEMVLVLTTKGKIRDLASALQKIEMDWLGDQLIEGEDPDDDFYQENDKGARLKGKIQAQLFMSMTSRSNLETFISQWNRYQNGQALPFGLTGLKDVFDHLVNVEFWGPSHRIIATGFQDYLNQDDPTKEVDFHIELWFRDDPRARRQAEEVTTSLLERMGGTQITSYSNPDIRFHSIKAQAPVSIVRLLIDNIFDEKLQDPRSDIFYYNGIMYFTKPTQCSISLGDQVDYDAPKLEDRIPGAPRIALLDGLPLAGHQLFRNRLIIDDPDGLTDQYPISARKHGTAMASIILHGDLEDRGRVSIKTSLYVRPVMEPKAGLETIDEWLISGRFPEDLIEQAVVRMFEGDGEEPPAAPEVKVINLSLGDAYRPFDREMSSWARLIDYLSYEYKVLFIISAGNQPDVHLGMTEMEHEQLTDAEARERFFSYAFEQRLQRRIISPAEAINALTIGSTHEDKCVSFEKGLLVDLLPGDDSLPSPITPIGGGLRNSIKPEILLPGGRQLFRGMNRKFSPTKISRPPGVKSAATDPANEGRMDATIYSRGTSNAAALATHAAGHILETIDQIKTDPGGERIKARHLPILIKAMMVHGCQLPSEIAEELASNDRTYKRPEQCKTALYGYGVPDLGRVLACTQQRATVIGVGDIKKALRLHEFVLPIPRQIDRYTKLRRLTITLAWFTPINPCHRQYYRAKLKLELPEKKRQFKRNMREFAKTQVRSPGVKNGFYDRHQITRGTTLHASYEGKAAVEIFETETIKIQIELSTTHGGGPLDDEIPYALVASFEVAETENLPIYEAIRERLRPEIATRIKDGE